MRTRSLAVLLLAASTSYAPKTSAQPPAAEAPPGRGTAAGGSAEGAEGGPEGAAHDDQAARWLFNSAREAFEAGDYEAALDRFEQSYRLSQRPALLYNIGTTLDRLRRDADALEAFRRYLELVPDSSNRSEIEARVIVLERAIARRQAEDAERERIEAERHAAEQARLEAERDAAEARSAVEEEEGIPRWAFWTVAGAGGATLALGVTFHGLTANRNGVYEDYVDAHAGDCMSGCSPDQLDAARAENLRTSRGLYDDAVRMRNLTIGMYAATAALGVGAGVMVPFTNWGGGEDGEAQDPAAPSGEAGLRLAPGSLTLGLRHRF